MAYNHLEEIPQPLTTLQMHGNHFLPAFWLLPFLLSANISVKALPQAQSDFNIIVPLNNHDGRPTGTLGQGGGDSDFIIPNEGPTYPILLNEQLLRPEPPLRGDVAVVDVVVANNNDQNCRSSSSSSSDNNNNNYSQSSLFRKREVLACPPPRPDSSPDLTPEPTPKSTPKSTPDSTPELIAPHITFQESDDDKCPPNLMGMSRIPVCDSGRPGEDSMRLAGFDYYTLFKITPDEGSGCITPSWPWCCASIGKQRHPLWLDRDDVETGYICKDKDREEWYAKYPDPEGPSFDGGKDLELGWKKRKAKRALHNF